MAQKPTTSATSSAPAGMRKRQQIATISRTMFLWVAGASIIVAFALVGSIFLTKQLLFNQKIIIEKNKTADTLNKNISSAKTLNRAVNQLRADRNISRVPASTATSNNLDKILDALPYEGDYVGLGSSLQSTLLGGIAIESLTVDATAGDELSASGIDLAALETMGDTQPITFTFKVSGSDAELKTLLARLNSSIRPMKILNMKLEAAGPDKLDATVQALTYYQPKKTFQLQEETIKP